MNDSCNIQTWWGWPIVCITSVSELPKEWQPSDWSIASGIQFGTRTRFVPPALIPIRPIWLHLGVNTALYAFVAFVITLLYIRLRNSIRRKRGLCIHCRYNVHDLSVCPECGSDVDTR